MKDRMRGMLQQVRLGQVRKEVKSSIIQPPLLFRSILWNSEKNCQISVHPGGVRWWKNWLSGLVKPVRLGQVRKAIQSWKREARGPSIHSLTCFGQKFERMVFERTTSSPFKCQKYFLIPPLNNHDTKNELLKLFTYLYNKRVRPTKKEPQQGFSYLTI